jgi:hypothetical protein
MSARRITRARVLGTLAAVAGLIGLSGVGPLGSARADKGGFDPVAGSGNTNSAVALTWADGITGRDNKTIVTQRQPQGTNPFVDDLWSSYKDLKVTVSQTAGLTHQGVQVTWTGGTPTPGNWLGDYLQIMQCYGDANTGPDPEGCQWGAFNSASLPDGSGFGQDSRSAAKCPSDNPSVPSGCDPAEPTQPDHQDPCEPVQYAVPFVPVGTNTKKYNRTPIPGCPQGGSFDTNYDQFSTNEVPSAFTSADGTGRETFEAQTGSEATGLGCGFPDAGAPRGCWLVIVPRANDHPNGAVQRLGVSQSALGASNWSQRLQVHLTFLPVGGFCPQGTNERPLVGTELITTAIQSWQPALCANGGTVYSFAGTADPLSAVQLASDFPGAAGLAFTVRPVDFGGSGPPVVYAPVAITAMTVAFRVEVTNGQAQRIDSMKLTPQLLAKQLTQSYRNDVPGGIITLPKWIATGSKAYDDFAVDPQWSQLNPGVRDTNGPARAPLTTADQSAVNGAVWSWIQSDPGTRGWLRGQPDANGMVVNPGYRSLHLGDPPASASFPRADSTCYLPDITPKPPANLCLTSVDLLPYLNSLDDVAVHVQRATSGGRSPYWNSTTPTPDGTSSGYWPLVDPEPTGRRYAWGVTATSDAAHYGLQDAPLCNADGSGCQAPSADSLRAAVDAAKPDSSGLLEIDPANPGGGYPLTQVVYAAVRTNQDAAALRDDAHLLDYVAGPGQKSGVDPGQLPAGYLPLPDALRRQTQAVADTLRADAAAQHNPPASGNQQPNGPGAGPSQNPPTGPNHTTGAANGANHPGSAPPVPGPPNGTGLVPNRLAGQPTPRSSVGAIRWALVGLLIAGLLGALAGPAMRHPPTRLIRLIRRI